MSTNTASVFITDTTTTNPQSIFQSALSYWSDYEAERDDHPRSGTVRTVAPVSNAVAELTVDELMMNTNNPVIIPVVDSFTEKSDTVELTLTAEEFTQLSRGEDWFLNNRLGQNIIKFEVTSTPKPRAPKAEATDGKAVTKYFLSTKTVHGFFNQVAGPFDSQAEARAAGVVMVAENTRMTELHVTAQVIRETGDKALVTISRPTVPTNKVKVKVTRQIPKANAKVVGYLVGFNYQS
jgi:hypothetical protein